MLSTHGYGRAPQDSPRARAQKKRDKRANSTAAFDMPSCDVANVDTTTTLSEAHALELLEKQSSWVTTLKESCEYDNGKPWWLAVSTKISLKKERRGHNYQRIKRATYVTNLRHAISVCEKSNQFAAAYRQAAGFQVIMSLIPPFGAAQGTTTGGSLSIQMPSNDAVYQPLVLGVRSMKDGTEILCLASPEEIESSLLPALQLGLESMSIKDEEPDDDALDVQFNTSVANALCLIPKDVASQFVKSSEEAKEREETEKKRFQETKEILVLSQAKEAWEAEVASLHKELESTTELLRQQSQEQVALRSHVEENRKRREMKNDEEKNLLTLKLEKAEQHYATKMASMHELLASKEEALSTVRSALDEHEKMYAAFEKKHVEQRNEIEMLKERANSLDDKKKQAHEKLLEHKRQAHEKRALLVPPKDSPPPTGVAALRGLHEKGTSEEDMEKLEELEEVVIEVAELKVSTELKELKELKEEMKEELDALKKMDKLKEMYTLQESAIVESRKLADSLQNELLRGEKKSLSWKKEVKQLREQQEISSTVNQRCSASLVRVEDELRREKEMSISLLKETGRLTKLLAAVKEELQSEREKVATERLNKAHRDEREREMAEESATLEQHHQQQQKQQQKRHEQQKKQQHEQHQQQLQQLQQQQQQQQQLEQHQSQQHQAKKVAELLHTVTREKLQSLEAAVAEETSRSSAKFEASQQKWENEILSTAARHEAEMSQVRFMVEQSNDRSRNSNEELKVRNLTLVDDLRHSHVVESEKHERLVSDIENVLLTQQRSTLLAHHASQPSRPSGLVNETHNETDNETLEMMLGNQETEQNENVRQLIQEKMELELRLVAIDEQRKRHGQALLRARDAQEERSALLLRAKQKLVAVQKKLVGCQQREEAKDKMVQACSAENERLSSWVHRLERGLEKRTRQLKSMLEKKRDLEEAKSLSIKRKRVIQGLKKKVASLECDIATLHEEKQTWQVATSEHDGALAELESSLRFAELEYQERLRRTEEEKMKTRSMYALALVEKEEIWRRNSSILVRGLRECLDNARRSLLSASDSAAHLAALSQIRKRVKAVLIKCGVELGGGGEEEEEEEEEGNNEASMLIPTIEDTCIAEEMVVEVELVGGEEAAELEEVVEEEEEEETPTSEETRSGSVLLGNGSRRLSIDRQTWRHVVLNTIAPPSAATNNDSTRIKNNREEEQEEKGEQKEQENSDRRHRHSDSEFILLRQTPVKVVQRQMEREQENDDENITTMTSLPAMVAASSSTLVGTTETLSSFQQYQKMMQLKMGQLESELRVVREKIEERDDEMEHLRTDVADRVMPRMTRLELMVSPKHRVEKEEKEEKEEKQHWIQPNLIGWKGIKVKEDEGEQLWMSVTDATRMENEKNGFLSYPNRSDISNALRGVSSDGVVLSLQADTFARKLNPLVAEFSKSLAQLPSAERTATENAVENATEKILARNRTFEDRPRKNTEKNWRKKQRTSVRTAVRTQPTLSSGHIMASSAAAEPLTTMHVAISSGSDSTCNCTRCSAGMVVPMWNGGEMTVLKRKSSPLKGKALENVNYRRVNSNTTSQRRGSYFGNSYSS